MTETNVADSKSARLQQHADLLKRALEQPGVADVMKIQENWEKVDQILTQYNLAVRTKPVVSSSASTAE